MLCCRLPHGGKRVRGITSEREREKNTDHQGMQTQPLVEIQKIFLKRQNEECSYLSSLGLIVYDFMMGEETEERAVLDGLCI